MHRGRAIRPTKGAGGFLDGGTAFIRQSTISGNTATSGDGGGLLLEGSAAAATVLQSTIADNSAGTSGGGVRIAAGNVLVHNTIVAENSAFV